MKYLVFLGFFIIGISNSYGLEISYNYASTRKACPSSVVDKLAQIQKVFSLTYQDLVTKKEVAFWEMEDRKSRFPHYCFAECACLQQKYSEALASSEVQGIQIFGMAVSGGQGLLPVEVTDGTYKHSYNRHQVTVIYVNSDQCYVVADPIIQKDKLISVKEWLNSITSIQQNKIFMWKFKPETD